MAVMQKCGCWLLLNLTGEDNIQNKCCAVLFGGTFQAANRLAVVQKELQV